MMVSTMPMAIQPDLSEDPVGGRECSMGGISRTVDMVWRRGFCVKTKTPVWAGVFDLEDQYSWLDWCDSRCGSPFIDVRLPIRLKFGPIRLKSAPLI